MRIDDLANEIKKTLEDYSKVGEKTLKEAAEIGAKEAMSELKAGNYEDRRGKYRKSFKVEKSNNGKKVAVKSKEYRLTHLLEKGHMTRNGTSRTKAFPHWKKAEEKAIKEYEERIKRGLEN